MRYVLTFFLSSLMSYLVAVHNDVKTSLFVFLVIAFILMIWQAINLFDKRRWHIDISTGLQVHVSIYPLVLGAFYTLGTIIGYLVEHEHIRETALRFLT